MTKPIIAVDIDDVLAASTEGWILYTNKRWGMELKHEDYDEDWPKTWRVDHDEGIKRAQDIYESGIQGKFEAIPGAKPVLTELSERFTLVIITSRVSRIHDQTVAWLDQHFNGIFTDVHLAGFYETISSASVQGTKGELVSKIGASYLIDDQPKHCLSVASEGVEAILFGDYHWHQDMGELPPHVTRCKDWEAVREFFRERS